MRNLVFGSWLFSLRMPVIILVIMMGMAGLKTYAQDAPDTAKLHVVIKNDGTEFVGRIISQDAREVLIETKKVGQVIIPKHEIREIRELMPGQLSEKGEYLTEEFATRYFLTTNGLPVEKGESYVQWNLFGGDFQFGVAKNLTLGVMSTWLGVPLAGTAKYSIPLDENISMGVGAILGSFTWIEPTWGLALPFATFTLGNRRNNISFSTGYGAFFADGDVDGRTLLSVGGMTKVGKKVSLVFDSFIVPSKGSSESFAVFVPGIRFQTGPRSSFQFGFAGIYADGETIPVPIPMIQWYRKL